MKTQEALFPVERMAQVLGVSKSGYYAWRSRGESKRDLTRRLVDVRVKATFEDSHGRSGSLKIARALTAQGHATSRRRAADSMRRQGLVSKVRRKFIVTTASSHRLSPAPNLLNRAFDVDTPNTVWVSDITYLSSRSGWLYLVVFIDLFSRRVVGWQVSDSLAHEMVLTALERAVYRRRPGSGLLIHSGRGVQYCCDGFHEAIERYQLVQSRNPKGVVGLAAPPKNNCWDNTAAEPFFRAFKTEWAYHVELIGLEHARRELFEYIDRFYNHQRRHATLDFLSPSALELRKTGLFCVDFYSTLLMDRRSPAEYISCRLMPRPIIRPVRFL